MLPAAKRKAQNTSQIPPRHFVLEQPVPPHKNERDHSMLKLLLLLPVGRGGLGSADQGSRTSPQTAQYRLHPRRRPRRQRPVVLRPQGPAHAPPGPARQSGVAVHHGVRGPVGLLADAGGPPDGQDGFPGGRSKTERRGRTPAAARAAAQHSPGRRARRIGGGERAGADAGKRDNSRSKRPGAQSQRQGCSATSAAATRNCP